MLSQSSAERTRSLYGWLCRGCAGFGRASHGPRRVRGLRSCPSPHRARPGAIVGVGASHLLEEREELPVAVAWLTCCGDHAGGDVRRSGTGEGDEPTAGSISASPRTASAAGSTSRQRPACGQSAAASPGETHHRDPVTSQQLDPHPLRQPGLPDEALVSRVTLSTTRPH